MQHKISISIYTDLIGNFEIITNEKQILSEYYVNRGRT